MAKVVNIDKFISFDEFDGELHVRTTFFALTHVWLTVRQFIIFFAHIDWISLEVYKYSPDVICVNSAQIYCGALKFLPCHKFDFIITHDEVNNIMCVYMVARGKRHSVRHVLHMTNEQFDRVLSDRSKSLLKTSFIQFHICDKFFHENINKHIAKSKNANFDKLVVFALIFRLIRICSV